MDTLLTSFAEFLKKTAVYEHSFIVGGAVRDFLLNSEIKDIDIALKGDAIEIAKDFSAKADATFVMLDEEHGVARIVKDKRHIDISKMQGASIYEDLANRDITINAMAIPIGSLDPSSVIDPLVGKTDLDSKVIRMVSENNLLKDPLRLLRIYRFSAELNFSIEQATLDAAKKLANLIISVSAERIMEELKHIVRLSDSYNTIKKLQENNILQMIFPELEENFEVNGLELYKNLENVLNKMPHLAPSDFKRICLKISAFFKDADTAQNASLRLKMSNKEVSFIHKMALNRSLILMLYKESNNHFNEALSVRLLKEFKDDVYQLAALAIAQMPDISYFCNELLEFYDGTFKARMRLLPLLTGNDLIKEFNLEPSALFKEILTSIDDLVLEGKISSYEEAREIALQMLKNIMT